MKAALTSTLSLLLLASAAHADGRFMKLAQDKKDLWATLTTSQGDVVVHLFSKDAPKTVANFVGLAESEKEATDDKSVTSKKRLYDNTIFHRIIEGFMIQGGDPTGTGHGSPGFTFEDEFATGRKFDRVGLLAMANRGPATNGSQFFITVSTPTHLNGKHTIFGEVVSGYDVVEAISKVSVGMGSRPLQEVKLLKVVISEKQPRLAAPAKKEKK